jgi:hypothetical protein
MEATKVCTLGQITAALFEVGGQYRRNIMARTTFCETMYESLIPILSGSNSLDNVIVFVKQKCVNLIPILSGSI